ncbi:MAG: hypothetical protein IT322_07205 [Anaerolineae bacterium]|nr:hypothetical protein [Anaerolineae bacterium]CAG1005167.1 hypothetical protein ANRL4_03510 [Anaerolineae bacterium]
MGRITVHPDCRDFVSTVENLLKRRQQQMEITPYRLPLWQKDDWGPRSWTRTELEDMVYSSFKRMRQGHITRPPRRQTVMEIADYLNCTLEERNRLLMAAHISPVAPYFTGERLVELLQEVTAVAQQLVIPALIINRDWHIHYLNDQALRLQNVSTAQLASIPPEHFNLLRLMFDPQLPLYPNLIQNHTSWVRMARQTLYGFKMANLLCQFEPWYQTLVDDLMGLPDFADHWHTIDVDLPFSADFSVQNLPSSVTVETTFIDSHQKPRQIWLRPLVISAGYFQFDFPQIVAFLPADQNSYGAFSEIGLQGLGQPLRLEPKG